MFCVCSYLYIVPLTCIELIMSSMVCTDLQRDWCDAGINLWESDLACLARITGNCHSIFETQDSVTGKFLITIYQKDSKAIGYIIQNRFPDSVNKYAFLHSYRNCQSHRRSLRDVNSQIGVTRCQTRATNRSVPPYLWGL